MKKFKPKGDATDLMEDLAKKYADNMHDALIKNGLSSNEAKKISMYINMGYLAGAKESEGYYNKSFAINFAEYIKKTYFNGDKNAELEKAEDWINDIESKTTTEELFEMYLNTLN